LLSGFDVIPCHSEPGGLVGALAALGLVWGALALGALLRPWLGLDAAVLLAFALALGALAATGSVRLAARAAPACALGLVAGFASYPAWLAACLAWVLALGIEPARPGAQQMPSAARCLAALALAPLVEELLYRGRLLPPLRARLGAGPALALTSALFALPHAEPAPIAACLLVGAGLGALRLASRSLALCVGLHAGLNLAALLSGLPPTRAALDLPAAALAGAGLLVPATWWLRRAA
jgi:membrane protease YdiL (CAAX protease family)